jgi:oligopeptidase A
MKVLSRNLLSRFIRNSGFAILSSTIYLAQSQNCTLSYSSKPNAILDYRSLPAFSDIKVSDIDPSIQECVEKLKSDFNSIESNLRSKQNTVINYQNTVEMLEKSTAPLDYSWGIVNHLMGVQNSDALRDVHKKLQPSVVQINQVLGQSKVIYDSLSYIKESDNWKTLDEAQKRIVDASLKGMKNSGVGLSDDKRAEFNALQLEMSELSTRFNNNILDAVKSYKLKLTLKSEVDGLPQSALSLAAQQAVKEGFEGATAENGPWIVTLDIPMYLPCMQHLKNSEIRQKLYLAYVSKASSENTDNSEIIKDILSRKQKMAHMLV